MLDWNANPLADEFGDDLPVAVFRVALIAEEAHRTPGGDKAAEFVELVLRGWRRNMLGKNAPHLFMSAGSGGLATLRRRSKAAQMEIAHATTGDAGGQQALGESGAPG